MLHKSMLYLLTYLLTYLLHTFQFSMCHSGAICKTLS